MSTKIGINGFGRIGRLVLRAGLEDPDLEFVAVNDVTDAKTLAHLFKYDSLHGIYPGEVKAEGNKIKVNGKAIEVLSEKEPTNLPWKSWGVDLVIESTGKFTTGADCMKHIQAGAKKVLISAPHKKSDVPVQMIVPGINEELYDGKKYQVYSIGSCTTNGLAPVVKVLSRKFGIERGFMTTIHAYTNDQKILDLPHKDLRRARAAALSIIPTSTGAAKAISLVLPELEGKMDGIAVRVPVGTGSLIDLTCILSKEVTVEEINKAMKEAAQGELEGILQYCEEPIVSVDVIHNSYSSVFDSLLTMAKGKTVKVFAWYDNEWGFSCRMIDMLKIMAK
jgi:glyceraldehyde 3-phosphate dehydrogenase